VSAKRESDSSEHASLGDAAFVAQGVSSALRKALIVCHH
jgi:hypothetical protein